MTWREGRRREGKESRKYGKRGRGGEREKIGGGEENRKMGERGEDERRREEVRKILIKSNHLQCPIFS